MQNYTEKNIEGIKCVVNSDLAEAMDNNRLVAFQVENCIRALKRQTIGNYVAGIDPNNINFKTGEFCTELEFMSELPTKRFVIRGEVVFEGKDEEGFPESWRLNEGAGLEIQRVR